MYIITKSFKFEAAHHLTKVPLGHQCGRPHGHSYEIIVECRASRLDNTGFVVDYGQISHHVKPFIETYMDHFDLNETLSLLFCGGPSAFETTAENIAQLLFWEFRKAPWGHLLYSVTVKETATSSATYYVEP